MPQPGEIRHGATESVQWDGSRWNPMPRNASAEAGYHPSLADSDHPFLSALKGFVSGASEAATPGKVGTLAALTVPGVGEAAGAGALTMAAIEALRNHFNTANHATSFPEAAADVAGAATPALVGGAVSKVGGLLGDIVDAGAQMPGKIGTAAKAIRAVKNGVSSLAGSSIGDAPSSLAALDEPPSGFAAQPRDGMPFARGAEAGARVQSPADPFEPSPRFEQSGPSPEFQAAAPRLVKTGNPSLEDRLSDVLKGLGDDSSASTSMGDTPSVRSIDRGNAPDLMQQYVDSVSGPVPEFQMDGVTYRPDASGSHVAVKPALAPQHPVTPTDIGYNANADLGAGNSAGNDAMVPTEYRQEDESWYTPKQPDEVDLTDAITPSGSDGPSAANLPDSLRAIDALFGPGASDVGGEPLQSMSGKGGNNLLYDPQTPSDYLREQAQHPDTPPEESEFLNRALRQRLRLGQSAAFQGLLPR